MHKTNPKNISQFILKSPSRTLELIRKVHLRYFDKKNSMAMAQYEEWLAEKVIDFESYAESIDESLWREASNYATQLKRKAETTLSHLPKLGGGGIYPLLFFLTRKLQPNVIVESGVAAGFSSQVFLKAMQLNGKGKLYSSDFPMFRLSEPEQYVGVMVEEDLKKNWTTYLEGDRVNLPKIMNEINHIDLFHYDSDKTYNGRTFAANLIQKKLSPKAIVIFDDIQNNTHFFDHVTKHNIKDYKIFNFEGKYVGMIGAIQCPKL